jgi:hypothetical protein
MVVQQSDDMIQSFLSNHNDYSLLHCRGDVRSTTMFLFLTLLVLCAPLHTRGVSILSFGAVANSASNAASQINAAALTKAMYAVNSDPTDRVVIIPAGLRFTFFNVTLSKLTNVVLRVDGTMAINNNISAWPQLNNDGGGFGCFEFVDCVNVTLEGSGMIDGQGYDWWWYVWITGNDKRPHMLVMQR